MRTPWIAAWALTGALWMTGLLAVLSFGVFLLPVAALATVLLAARRPSRGHWAGALVGAGLPLGWAAYLNRSGPGSVCHTTATSQSCVDQSNPWWWLAAAAVLIGLGVALLTRTLDNRSAVVNK